MNRDSLYWDISFTLANSEQNVILGDVKVPRYDSARLVNVNFNFVSLE